MLVDVVCIRNSDDEFCGEEKRKLSFLLQYISQFGNCVFMLTVKVSIKDGEFFVKYQEATEIGMLQKLINQKIVFEAWQYQGKYTHV